LNSIKAFINKKYVKCFQYITKDESEEKMENDTIFKPMEVAAILGVGRNTIYSILRRPDFPVLKIGRLKRVSQSALDEWINKHTQSKGGQQ